MIYRTKADGNTFKELRRKKGFSQSEVALYLSVAQTAVSKWERGLTIPDQRILPKIAELYNTTVDYLLTGKESIKPIVSTVEKQEKPYILKIFECMSEDAKEQLTNYAEGVLMNENRTYDIDKILKEHTKKL